MAGKGPLLALTLHRPWSAMIAYGTKRVENREWEPPDHVIGRHIAIHSGMAWDEEGAEKLRDEAEELRIAPPGTDEQYPKGVILCVAKIVGAVEIAYDGDSPPAFKSKLGPLTPGEVKAALESPWATGPWCWCLSDVTAFPEPLPCRGARKLWPVPSAIAVEVRKRYAAAKGLRYVA